MSGRTPPGHELAGGSRRRRSSSPRAAWDAATAGGLERHGPLAPRATLGREKGGSVLGRRPGTLRDSLEGEGTRPFDEGRERREQVPACRQVGFGGTLSRLVGVRIRSTWSRQVRAASLPETCSRLLPWPRRPLDRPWALRAPGAAFTPAAYAERGVGHPPEPDVVLRQRVATPPSRVTTQVDLARSKGMIG